MFIARDARKVLEILFDESDARETLRLGRRAAEFGGDGAGGGAGSTASFLDPSHGARLSRCTSLSLYGNGLGDLAHWETLAAHARGLEEVDLGKNALAELPAAFGDCGALRRLWLEDNALASFPRPLLRCSRLAVLRLSGNPLGRLPRGIAALEELEELVRLERRRVLRVVSVLLAPWRLDCCPPASFSQPPRRPWTAAASRRCPPRSAR